MALSRTRSYGPGNIAIEDPDAGNVTSGNVSGDGRVQVRFHESPQTVAAWCERFQGALGDQGEGVSLEPPRPRPRRASSAAFLQHLREQRKAAGGPRLHIAIHIVGSRGDVQPFIPIAQLLSRPRYGHRVRICTHPVFKTFVEEQGVEFFSIGGDPEALMAYMVKNPGLLPSRESFKAGEISKRRKEMWEIINGAWRSCIEAGDGMGPRVKAANVSNTDDLFLADAIIANPPSMAHIHCAEKLGIPLHMVFTMPWSPTEAFPHPLANMSYGSADASVANYLSFMTMELLTLQGLGDLINKFHLVAFLEKGPPPIYIGFGSIVVDDPKALTRLIFEAVQLAGVRAVVSKGWCGVGSEDDVPEDIYLIGNCAHDWLFRRVSAVVHHGGAGTTAAGIAAGRPTVIVPFFGDQPFWGRMIAGAGAGPTPVPFKEMTAESLTESITFALKPEVQVAVVEMARRIAAEDGAGDTARDFQRRLDMDSLRCDVCPERLATWRHKKTDAHLSGFAVGCLVDQGLMQPSDIKLLRHRHWYVDEGAEHPVIGAVAAVTGFLTAVGTATADYSRRLKARPRPEPGQPSSTPSDKPMTARPPSSATRVEAGEEDISTVSMNQTQVHDGVLKDFIPANTLTPADMETLALQLATKSLRLTDPAVPPLKEAPTFHERRKAAWRAQEQGRNGRVYYVARATRQYAADVSRASLKAPVALFYNIANGCHNYPSYGLSFGGVEVRRRDEITGLGSGVRTAGKEFGLGVWDAVSGIVVKPYEGVKEEGVKGFGKGMWRAGRGFFHNLGAALFGLPGYTLKGVERELSKHHLTKLKAELLLIRTRQGIDDFRRGPPTEREEVIKRWKVFLAGAKE